MCEKCKIKDLEIQKLTVLLEERDETFQKFADGYHKQFERYERGYCIHSDTCKHFQRCITFATDIDDIKLFQPRYELKDEYK